MSLTRLAVTDLRNLEHFSIEPSEQLNVIYGQNGSGKTSFLEAIYLLSHGRSFRSHLINRVIRHEQDALTIFSQVVTQSGRTVSLGLEKSKKSGQKICVEGEAVSSLAELAQHLPLQLIDPHSYHLLESGPKYRRQFMDWGLFHVEPSFFRLWQRVQKCLQQRNAALRDPAFRNQAQCWDKELITAAEAIDAQRRHYLSQLEPLFREILDELLVVPSLSLAYRCGWAEDDGLSAVLARSFSRDCAQGFTHYGPHRADIVMKSQGSPVQDELSRGQQKLLICALRIAQGLLLHRLTPKRCVFLMDDMPSELDNERQQRVTQLLLGLGAQVFVTGISKDDVSGLAAGAHSKVFHVEHGVVRDLSAVNAEIGA